MIPADQIKKNIWKKYDKDPGDWHVLVGKDRKNYYDLIVIHGSDAWLIKEQPINPLQSIGFGVRDNLLNSDITERMASHAFGLRPLSEQDATKVAGALGTGRSLSRIINKILNTKPVSSSELESPMALQGPVLHRPESITEISENQAELDKKLQVELEKHLYRRYAHTIAPYL
jgi:hypothetical protein